MDAIWTQGGSRPLIVLGLLICAFVLTLPGAGAADTFRVVNVPPGDVLNVRAGPSVAFPVLGRLAPNATGVEALGACVERWCPVRDGLTLGWAHGRFLEREAEGADLPAGGEATLALGNVLEDGTLERTLADGRRLRRLPTGSLQTVWPDGRVTVSSFVTAPGPDLPSLPAEVSGWAGAVSDDLLVILENILTSDEMAAYLETEEGKDLIQVLNWRLTSIRFLTSPSS